MKQDKVELMLALIEQRLSSYSVENTIDRLHSYRCIGPTISEFVSTFDPSSALQAVVGGDRELPIYSAHFFGAPNFCLDNNPSSVWCVDQVANDEVFCGQDYELHKYSLAA